MRAQARLIVLSCLLAPGGCSAPPNVGSASATESAPAVQLTAAEVVSQMPPCGPGCNFNFDARLVGRVHVANLGYEKHVFANYRVRAGNGETVQDWTRADATWIHDDDWELVTPSFVGTCPHYCAELVFELAIGYEVAGQTYWDNNGGWNYQLASDIQPIPGDPGPPAQLGATHVQLADTSWSPSDNTWRGRIILDNLAFEKQVDLVFSTDGWRTVQSAPAQYQQHTSHDLEYWSFAVPLPADAAGVDFAVRYRVAGQEYWDNHLGVDYHVAAPRLVFYETFDDERSLLHPALGPSGQLAGTPAFVPGTAGSAYYVTTAESAALRYPGTIVPTARGTIELDGRLFAPPAEIPWHASPYFFLAPVGDYEQYTLGMNGNDGWGGGGLIGWAGHGNMATGCFDGSYRYADVLGGAAGVERWHRFAVAWDEDGVAGTTDTMRLYVDGKAVGTSTFCGESHRPARFGPATDFFVGFIQDNFGGSAMAIDELRIWNYARTN